MTALGFAIRLASVNQGPLGDELSTYWIIRGHSLGHVLSAVRSDDEITPPLYFALGWITGKIGSQPEWIRLPSLIAGTISIPLVYAVGARTIGRLGGLVATALMALSPFMIYYSTEARSYSLMIALLLASTLGLLLALDTGRSRWWVLYAVCACGALLSHYTALFPLGAQALWLVCAHRRAIRAFLLANVGVLIGFAPWIPGFIADNNSPTTAILSALQPFTLEAVREALQSWGVGYPFVQVSYLPGKVGLALIGAGLILGALSACVAAWRTVQRTRPSIRAAVRSLDSRIVLVFLLALSTPVGESVYSAFGTNLFGARNLNASWPGVALALGALAVAAGPVLGIVVATSLIGGFAIGALKTLGPDVARPDYGGVAKLIDERAAPKDVVADGAVVTPVPLTGLDIYLPQTYREFRLGLPNTDHPLTVFDPVPDVAHQLGQAIAAARGRSLFLIVYQPSRTKGIELDSRVDALRRAARLVASSLHRQLPNGSKVISRTSFAGLNPLLVLEVSVAPKRPRDTGLGPRD